MTARLSRTEPSPAVAVAATYPSSLPQNASSPAPALSSSSQRPPHQQPQPQSQPPTNNENGFASVPKPLPRRLTAHCTTGNPIRPPVRRANYKSSSAIPTLSTTSVQSSGTATPAVINPFTTRLSRPNSMSAHEGVNPHTAADLLRQAMLHSKASDDEHDQIGSNSSTPPGAATPRPDPTDKRFPSILHSYFGQVCDSFRSCPKSENSTTYKYVPSAGNGGLVEGRHQSRIGGDPLPTAPCSPTEASSGDDVSPPLLPHELLHTPAQAQSSQLEPSYSYPTPPTSSASSMYRPKRDNPSVNTSGSDSSFSSRRRSTRDEKDITGASPLKLRKHTFAVSNPLCSIITTSSVLAAHILNPATRSPPTSSPSPILNHSPTSQHPSAPQSDEDVSRLTEGATVSSRNQNTPPQTPRSRSHEGKASSNLAPPSKPGPKAATIGTPKGKLSVSISEGRGLRPSINPYVVCQFEWAEYISDGPRNVDGAQDDAQGKTNGAGGLLMRRTGSEPGRPMAIPMTSRQSSHASNAERDAKQNKQGTDPKWEHEAIFDVVGEHSEIDVSVYDRANQEAFLGHVRFCPNLIEYETPYDGWFTLEPREGEGDEVTGEIHLRINFQKSDKKHYGPEDFQILKLIGKGTFGQVFQVRKKDTKRIYAMKVLSKKVIVQKKEVAHTLGERNILVRTAMAESPFIVGLKFSFQTPTDLYLVTDYMSGGELFWHLQKEGRFQESRAKFYIAELILALQHLHEHDIVYRDLKPENILLDANGHIALCDFGLSKANIAENDTTNTFCGTTEYLAPEVLLDEHGYTKMVDFWSLGVLVFEMCCGWSPFYAEDTQQMYKNIAFGKVRFPRDALSTEGRNFVKGLLNRNPRHRLGATHDAEELKAHPFFADIDWDALGKKNIAPPFKPKLKSELDVSNFDPEFTNALNAGTGSLNARAAALASGVNPASTPLSPTMQAKFKGFTFVDESQMDRQFGARDNDLERMDEDEQENEDEKENEEEDDMEGQHDYPNKDRGERMSGVVPSQESEDGVFNNGNFEV